MLTFDIPLWQIFTLLSSTVLPLIVGLVTNRTTDAGVKAVLLAALSFGINLATELADALRTGTEYNVGTALVLGLVTFLVSVGIHYGFWKPTHVTEKVQEAFVKDKRDPASLPA